MTLALILAVLLAAAAGATARLASQPALATARTVVWAVERRLEGNGRHTHVHLAREAARC